ncbi:alcohol dehydrogenase catalytic domain-containing protein [Glaciihabitans sp. dw_435]|uniref:alcohol dehydrogenase catalytic domain-containing protein n=1 Tax=Glaciihabitans sp. dw_435 TaxID=2720081 RepID=UPI001BD48C1F|nr:alcohol dehydrogenase catalytic domain-containing protein [Glaciihabitans sp. dw_435]
MPRRATLPHPGQFEFTPPAFAMAWPGTGRAHELVAIPHVKLETGDVLVAIELAAICGSDVRTTAGHRVPPAPAPSVLGHERIGRVVAIGGGARVKAVDGRPVEIGSRVAWSAIAPCGKCYRCKAGLSSTCLTLKEYGHERMARGWELSGAFASHSHVLAGTGIVLLGDELPAAVAVPVSCATATVVAALEAAQKTVSLAGATVVITGAGVRGLTATAMATDAGARVVVSDPDPERRALALSFGAVAVADPLATSASRYSLASVLRSLGVQRSRVTIGLEMSGANLAVRPLVDAVDVGGVVVLAGAQKSGAEKAAAEVSIDPRRIVSGLLTVTGVHNYSPRHLQAAVDYLQGAWQRWPFAGLVGEVLPLLSVDEAIELAAMGSAPRIGIAP